MDPAEILATDKRETVNRKALATAPDAASWLDHPKEPTSAPTTAQRLAMEPQWIDPDPAQ